MAKDRNETRVPPYHKAALDGRVRPVAANEWYVELSYAGRLQHNVALTEQTDPHELAGTPTVLVPQCLDCRKVEAGYSNLFDCELAVQVFRRLEINRKRTRDRRALKTHGIDRLRAKSPLYDAARRQSKRHNLRYLYEVVHALEMPTNVDPNSAYWKPVEGPKPNGRPPADPWDLVMCAAIYGGKAKTTLVDFHLEAMQLYRDGLLRTEPAENWPSKALKKPWVRQKLKEAIGKAVLPVAHLVKVVASDKTGEEEQGAHTYKETVWGPRADSSEISDAGWDERAKNARAYTGLHLIISHELGLIVAAEAQPGNRNESAFIRELIRDMLRYSKVNPSDLLLDMGYSSPQLVQDVWDEHGIEITTPPKRNSKRVVSGCPRWAKLHMMYWMKFDEFIKKYGGRSVVESVNSALKEAHGEALKTIHPEAKLTEALAKALMHTVNRVLQVMLERGMGHPALKDA